MTKCGTCEALTLRNNVCSCSDCVSYDCLELRHLATRFCVCKTCENPKTCILKNRKSAPDSINVLKQIYSASEAQYVVISETCVKEPESKQDYETKQYKALCKEILKKKQPGKIVNENKQQVYTCYKNEENEKRRVENNVALDCSNKLNITTDHGDKINSATCGKIKYPKHNQIEKEGNESCKYDDIAPTKTNEGRSREEIEDLTAKRTVDKSLGKNRERRCTICKTCNKNSLKPRHGIPDDKSKDEITKSFTCPMARLKRNKDSSESKGEYNCVRRVIKSKSWRTDACSCSDCVSLNCFELRHHAETVCICKACETPKLCSLYKNNNAAINNATTLKQIFNASETQHGITVTEAKECNISECKQYCGINQKDQKENNISIDKNKAERKCKSCQIDLIKYDIKPLERSEDYPTKQNKSDINSGIPDTNFYDKGMSKRHLDPDNIYKSISESKSKATEICKAKCSKKLKCTNPRVEILKTTCDHQSNTLKNKEQEIEILSNNNVLSDRKSKKKNDKNYISPKSSKRDDSVEKRDENVNQKTSIEIFKTSNKNDSVCNNENKAICQSECQKRLKEQTENSTHKNKCQNQLVRKFIKYCPAYCPTCHKLYIDELNEKRLDRKTRVSLIQCPNCRNVTPKIERKEPTEQNKTENKSKINKNERKCFHSEKNRIIPEDFILTGEFSDTDSVIVQTACCTRNDTDNRESQNNPNLQLATPINRSNVCCPERFTSKEKYESSERRRILVIEKHKGFEEKGKSGIQCKSEVQQKKSNSSSHENDTTESSKLLNTTPIRPCKQVTTKITKSQDNMQLTTYIRKCVRKEIEEIRHSFSSPTNKKDQKGNNAICCSCSNRQLTNNDKPSEHSVYQKYSPAFYEKMKDIIYKEIKDIRDSFSRRNDNTCNQIDESAPSTRTSTDKREMAIDDTTTTKSECLTKNLSCPHDKRYFENDIQDKQQQKHQQIDSQRITLQTNNCGIKFNAFKSVNNAFICNKMNFESERFRKNKETIQNEEDLSSACCTSTNSNFYKYDTSTDKLTAQIMNVPYKQYKESISRPEKKPISSIELLKMIQEVYKACSCKVCECISSGLTSCDTEVCDCKPCDCPDCRAYRIANDDIVKNACKERKTDSSKCDCKPCECVKCKEDYLLKSCNCKYCECINCDSKGKRYKQTNFIVAPVRERLQRPYCQCSPCGCFDCAHPFGTAVPTHNNQETGTDDRRHMNCNCETCNNDNCESEGADTCNCDQQSKIIKKPVTSNINDYDIHYFIRKTNDKYLMMPYNKQPPATIYTSLTHHVFYPYQTKNAVISNSKYSSCKYSKTVSESILPQDYWTLRANAAKNLNCNCKPCECEQCRKHFLEHHIPHRCSKRFCEVCDCINCATLNLLREIDKKNKRINFSESAEHCDCKPCRCKHCSKYMITPILDNDDYTLDAETLTNFKENTACHSSQTLLEASDSERFIDIILSNKEIRNRRFVKDKLSSTRTQTSLDDSKHFKLCCANMLKSKYISSCNKHEHINSEMTNTTDTDDSDSNNNKIQHETKLYYNKLQDHRDKILILDAKTNSQILDHLTRTNSTASSTVSSFEHEGVIKGFNKEPNKRQPTTESSCSSGHDFKYSIRLPTSTVETCINDVMSLQTYNNSDKINLAGTINTTDEQFFDTNDHFEHDVDDGKLYKNLNSEKVNDCHQYINKVPTFKECQCNCVDCKSDNAICLSKNRFVVIKKNEVTQTPKSAINCNEDMSMSKELPCLFKKMNVTFSNNDRIVEWSDAPMHHYQQDTRNNNVMTDYPTVNYDSVRRTIKEAKQFSLELLNILQKYEKANKEFDSLTKRYRNEYKSESSEVDTQKQYLDQSSKYQVAYMKTISKYQSILDTENNIIYSSKETDYKENNTVQRKPSYILKKYYQVLGDCESSYPSQSATNKSEIDEQNTKKEADIKRKPAEEPTPINTEINNEENVEQEVDKKDILDQVITMDIKEPCTNITSSPNANLNITNDNKTVKSEEKLNLENLKNEYMQYSQHLEKAIDKCRRNLWGKKNKNTTSSSRGVTENNATQEKSQGLLRIDKDSSDLNTVFICHSQKDNEIHHKEIKPNILNIQQLDSLKQLLVPEKKDAAKSAKASNYTQICHDSHDVQSQAQMCNIFQSAPNMSSKRLEIKSGGTKSTVETSAINELTRKVSYDPLKVVFQTVRKVSDHSILLKWKIPENTTNIKGYEMLVDGRSIQKILNPKKNMAVLTCIPHADKVKVTVRTITTDPDGHSPCATVTVCTRS